MPLQPEGYTFSDNIFIEASEPKELVVVPGARHIDLYDRTDLIPINNLDEFFTTALIAGLVAQGATEHGNTGSAT